MTDRLPMTVALAKKSLFTLFSHKRFLFIPIFSAVTTIILAIILLTPVVEIENMAWETHVISTTDYLKFFGFLFLLLAYRHLISALTNAALSACLLSTIRKQSSSLWAGIKLTFKKSKTLVIWSLLLGTYGIGIRMCEIWIDNWEKRTFAQKLFLGAPWLSATFFVPQVIIDHQLTTFEAIHQSASLVIETWGKKIKPKISPGPIYFIIYLIDFLPLLIGANLFSNQIFIYASFMITISLVIVTSIIQSAIRVTTITALYLYAIKDRNIDQLYPINLLEKAIIAQKQDA